MSKISLLICPSCVSLCLSTTCNHICNLHCALSQLFQVTVFHVTVYPEKTVSGLIKPRPEFLLKPDCVLMYCLYRLVLLGILLAYIADAIIRVRDYTGNQTGTKMTPWPSWGWICAIVAAALWFVAGSCASCEIPCCALLPLNLQMPLWFNSIAAIELPRFGRSNTSAANLCKQQQPAFLCRSLASGCA